jgi:hypothetical protein
MPSKVSGVSKMCSKFNRVLRFRELLIITFLNYRMELQHSFVPKACLIPAYREDLHAIACARLFATLFMLAMLHITLLQP